MFKDLVKKSRSFRAYDPERRISREELLELVDTVRYAPSSGNMQPLCYYLASEKEQMDKILPLLHWAALLPERHLPDPGKEPVAVVVICCSTERVHDTRFAIRDVGVVAQTMILAAAEKDLGGIMIGNYDAKKLAEVLELPECQQPQLVVAFGKPAETIVLEDVDDGESVKYYRDENDVHHVPKRKLEDIIIN